MKVKLPSVNGSEMRYKLSLSWSDSPFKAETKDFVFDLSSNVGIEDLYDFLTVFKYKPYRRILSVSLNAEGREEEK